MSAAKTPPQGVGRILSRRARMPQPTAPGQDLLDPATRRPADVVHPRSRSGHDQFARHRVRSRGHHPRRRADRNSARSFRSRAGSSTTPRKSGRRSRASCTRPSPRRASGAADIAAIGITNQRETTVLWDRATGQPLANAIVWQDRRTAAHCDAARAPRATRRCSQRRPASCSTPISPAPSSSGCSTTCPAPAQRAARGELAFGTIDTWLVWNLTGGAAHVTDASNATRTLLFNIHTGDWDDELLRAARRSARGAAARRAVRRACTAERVDRRRDGADRRHRRRPAGGAVRPGLPLARPGQEHLRHRLLHADEHRRPGRRLGQQPADDRRLGSRQRHSSTRSKAASSSPAPSCSGCATAWAHPAPRRGRGAGRGGSRQRRRLSGAGLRRPRRAALGPVCARRDGRPDPRHDRGAHRPRRAGGDRLPERRRARRDASATPGSR